MKKFRLNTLLINPPQTYYRYSTVFSKYFPTGLSYVAALLDKEGFHVEVLDTLISQFEIKKGEKNTVTYGMSFNNIKNEIIKRRPDIVGIAGPFTAQAENALRISRIVKDIDPNIITVFGGPDVSVRAKEIMANSESIDFAVIGEGEYTMLELVDKLDRKNFEEIGNILGLAYRKDNRICINPPRPFIRKLDDLPLPAYHLLEMDAYLNTNDEHLYIQRFGRNLRELPIITSRGCPYNCCFCSIHLHMGKKLRIHSASQVLSHISHITQEYNVNHIHFEDDNLTLNKKRFETILDGIVEKGLEFTWDTPNGVRADHLGEDILKKMKRSGCVHFSIAPESGEQRVLNNVIDKRLNLDKVVDVARQAKVVGLPLHAFFVFGFPGETIQDMKKTLNFADTLMEKYDVSPGFCVATPLYGTRLQRECEEKGYLLSALTPKVLSESTQGKGVIKTAEFGPEDIKILYDQAYQRRSQRLIYKKNQRIVKSLSKYGIVGKLAAVMWISPAFSFIRKLKPRVSLILKNTFIQIVGKKEIIS